MEIFTLVKANIKRRKGAFIAVMLLTAIIISSSLSIFNFLDSKDKALEDSFKDLGDPTEVCLVSINYYKPELEDKVSSLDIVKKLDVYDALELLPWIRTFICRISCFECSNRDVQTLFREDLLQMYRMYGLEGGEEQ